MKKYVNRKIPLVSTPYRNRIEYHRKSVELELVGNASAPQAAVRVCALTMHRVCPAHCAFVSCHCVLFFDYRASFPFSYMHCSSHSINTGFS